MTLSGGTLDILYLGTGYVMNYVRFMNEVSERCNARINGAAIGYTK